jgi:hypothetical protein
MDTIEDSLAVCSPVVSNAVLRSFIQQKSLLKDLQPSHIADHKYYLEGERRRLLRRTVCTPGTRVHVLDDITRWTNDASSKDQTVYWLFGPAGSGKSTIAFTIARRFEFATDADDITVLGANFFCSRKFEETRYANYIVRTIVYQLALGCKPFAAALSKSGKFHIIHHDVQAQLEHLLIKPWKDSENDRLADPSTQNYLIVIDALDEIDGKGGSKFLQDLLSVINKHRLRGLKFFATSRPDPDLVIHLESFEDKQFCHLEQVPIEEVQADIATYLYASLPYFVGHIEMEMLAAQAAGSFIYAATVVKYLEDYQPPEQYQLLVELLSRSDLAVLETSLDETLLLDDLYLQILRDAFRIFRQDHRAVRLQFLYTFLCAAERISPSIVVDLLFPLNDSYTMIADDVLRRLHAVLYTEHDKVLWYHKSFPDFLFDRTRSKDFWCDVNEHHRLLTESCFRVMKEGLRFNIANIPSSFFLDNSTEQHITPALGYACRNWAHHLADSDSDPLLGTLADFLQHRVLFWIEAMNLLRSSNLCYFILRRVHVKAQVSIILAE